MNTSEVSICSIGAELSFEMLLRQLKICPLSEKLFQIYGNSFISRNFPSFSSRCFKRFEKDEFQLAVWNLYEEQSSIILKTKLFPAGFNPCWLGNDDLYFTQNGESKIQNILWIWSFGWLSLLIMTIHQHLKGYLSFSTKLWQKIFEKHLLIPGNYDLAREVFSGHQYICTAMMVKNSRKKNERKKD